MFRCTMFAAVVGAAVSGAWGQCQQGWSDAFVPAFMSGGYEATATIFDDGSGANLFVADLSRLGDAQGGLQVWDGQAWTTMSVPDGLAGGSQIVRGLNDSQPPRLVMTDEASARLNDVFLYSGGQWSPTAFPVGSGFSVAVCIEPGLDASSDHFYLGGLISRGSGKYSKVYEWNGQTWTALDVASDGASVSDLARFDDGSGVALYAAVRSSINGVAAAGVAKWDGAQWSEVGGGCPAYWPSLEAFDDGSGPALWALQDDGMVLAKWDGVSWASYPLEVRDGVAYSWQLTSVTLGGQPELVWVDRSSVGATLWKWDGIDGAPLGAFEGGWANDIVADGSGGLFAAGNFIQAGGEPAACVAAFDGQTWSPAGTEDVGNGAPGASTALSVGEQGGAALGRRVYVAAPTAGGAPTQGLATWDGQQWQSIGPADPTAQSLNAMAFGDLGAGARVFAAGGSTVQDWDGQNWSVQAGGIDGSVYSLTTGTIAGGTPMLFVGGRFLTIDGSAYNSVAAIDASGWVHLADGLPGQNGRVDHVQAMTLHNDGTDVALYAGGLLDDQDPSLKDGVVRWDGASWTRVGDPLGTSNVNVRALCSADLGDGLRLYAGGSFGGLSDDLNNVAAWDGASWKPVGQGMPDGVQSLTRIETNDGPRLAATTSLYTSGGLAERVYLWDGSMWTAFGAVADGVVHTVVQAPHEYGAIYLVGVFGEVSSVPSAGIARWGCEACVADFNGDGVVDTRDFIAFLNAWAHQESGADIDGNGVIDTRDVSAFLNVWSMGC